MGDKYLPIMRHQIEREYLVRVNIPTVSRRETLGNYDTLWLLRWLNPTGKAWEVIRHTDNGAIRYGQFDRKDDASGCFDSIFKDSFI